MPYTQPVNPQNQARSSYAWNNLSTFAKATTVFVTAVGGYVLARASGVFAGWGNETDAPTDGLVPQAEANALDIQSDASLTSAMKSSSLFSVKNQEPPQTSLTEFTEIQLTEKSGETASKTLNSNSVRALTPQNHRRGKRTDPPFGNEFQVNTYTMDDQQSADLAALPNGNVMVVWQSNGQDGSFSGIYGQILTATGTKIGNEFQISTYSLNRQESAALTALADGNVMVVWRSGCDYPCVGPDGVTYSIHGQVLTTAGIKIGAEFQINAMPGYKYDPAITALHDGNVMVVWSQNNIYGQVLTLAGVKIGTEFEINNPDSLFMKEKPSLTTLTNGNVMVTWTSIAQDESSGGGSGVYGQILTADGVKIGTEFRINTYTIGYQKDSAIATLANGNVMVVWVDDWQREGGQTSVYGQIFTASGMKIGTDFRVNTHAIGFHFNPAVTTLANGNIIITWESGCFGQPCFGQDSNTAGIYGQVLTPTGVKVGEEFQLNHYTLNDQTQPAIKRLLNGDIMAVWQSNGQDGSLNGIYGSVLPTGQPALEANTLRIYQGETKILNAANLQATNPGIYADDLLFQISNLQQGYFCQTSNPSIALTEFYQKNLTDSNSRRTERS